MMLLWPNFFEIRSTPFRGFWKTQILFGILLIASAIAILIFPEILVALAASVVLLGGVTMVGSGWRLRQLERGSEGFSVVERIEW